MDVCQNVSVSGECQQEQVLTAPSCSKLSTSSSSLDDLFSAQNTVSVSLLYVGLFMFSSLWAFVTVLAKVPWPTSSLQVLPSCFLAGFPPSWFEKVIPFVLANYTFTKFVALMLYTCIPYAMFLGVFNCLTVYILFYLIVPTNFCIFLAKNVYRKWMLTWNGCQYLLKTAFQAPQAVSWDLLVFRPQA